MRQGHKPHSLILRDSNSGEFDPPRQERVSGQEGNEC